MLVRAILKTLPNLFGSQSTVFPCLIGLIISEEEKIKWKCRLLMCSVQSLLWDDQRSQNTHASVWCEEAPWLQPMRLLNHQCFKAENTQAGSQWRKTFCLHTLQLFLHNSWQPQEAHAETLRREAFQLQTVQLFLHENGCPKDTHANTFGRKTFRLHTVQLLLHTNWESQDTLAESFTLKETNSEWNSHFTISLWSLCRLLFRCASIS